MAPVNTTEVTLRARAQWYRDGCDGLEDREGYFSSGDFGRDVADDIEAALAASRERPTPPETLVRLAEAAHDWELSSAENGWGQAVEPGDEHVGDFVTCPHSACAAVHPAVPPVPVEPEA